VGKGFDAAGRAYDMAKVGQAMSTAVSTVAIPLRGHLGLEDRPAVVNRELLALLAGWRG
jgi:hypothetical protein